MRRLMVAGTMLALTWPLMAAETCMTLNRQAIAELFDGWNVSLSSLDANQVVQRYWSDAVLLPTLSNTPRTGAAMIGDYFQHFLAKRPRGRVDTRTVQSGCNMATDFGTYTFSLMDGKGAVSEISGRYTFIYQYRDGGWKIVHHHSSAMPEHASAAPVEVHVAAEKPIRPAEPAPVAEPAAYIKSTVPEKPVVVEVGRRSEDVRPVQLARAKAPEAKSAAKPTLKIAAAPEPAEPTSAELKTAMFANLTASPPPSKFYPPEAGKRKESGNVNLRVCADDSGAVAGTPEVVKSSGSKLLDEAAQTWARAAKWVPATLNRRRVEGCTQVDVAFEPAA